MQDKANEWTHTINQTWVWLSRTETQWAFTISIAQFHIRKYTNSPMYVHTWDQNHSFKRIKDMSEKPIYTIWYNISGVDSMGLRPCLGAKVLLLSARAPKLAWPIQTELIRTFAQWKLYTTDTVKFSFRSKIEAKEPPEYTCIGSRGKFSNLDYIHIICTVSGSKFYVLYYIYIPQNNAGISKQFVCGNTENNYSK